MKEFKPATVSIEAQASRGIGCGCVLAGVGVIFALFMLLCVGSYFSLMHTSLPLALIKRGLEEDGKIKIEGLRGSIARGFEIDSLRFESYGPQWSELRDIKFRFNGIYDLARRERFIIEEASVGSGTIYAELEEPQDFNLDFDGDWGGEFSEALNEVSQELSDEDLQDLKEVRIDLVSVKDLKIVNPDTQLTLEIRDAEYSGFKALKGRVVSLGEIVVNSDHLDMTTSPSALFPEEPLSWQFDGRVKSEMHSKLLADIPFNFDFAVVDGKVHSRTKLLDGKVLAIDSPEEPYQLRLSELTPQEYYQLKTPLAASRLNLALTINDLVPPDVPAMTEDSSAADHENTDDVAIDKSGSADSHSVVQSNEPAVQETRSLGDADVASDSAASHEVSSEKGSEPPPRRLMKLEPGGYFYLAETKFEIVTAEVSVGPKGAVGAAALAAQAAVDDEQVDAVLTLLGHEPFTTVSLSSSSGKEPRELWGLLFYGLAYNDLDEEQRSKVDTTLEYRPFPEPVDF